MKMLIATATVLFATQAHATQVPFRDLTNLVESSDHILIGTVTEVDMVDGQGNQVTNESTRTGPGRGNQLRLHVTVATNRTIVSSAKVPDKIVIPLWQMWHYTFGRKRKQFEGKTFIFLLKGPNFLRVYYTGFMRKPSEQADIEAILKRTR